MISLRDVLGSQLLIFERPDRSPFGTATGNRLLSAFVLLAFVLHPSLNVLLKAAAVSAGWIGPAIVVSLLVAFLIVVRWFVGRELAVVGLYRWNAWTPRERIYVWTVAPLATTLFIFVFRGHYANLLDANGWLRFLFVSVPTGLLWGMVQEFIYRGLLQTWTVRRFGGVSGTLLANLVFTFGPLHMKYFNLGSGTGPRWGMFALIFGIGLFFGALYHRSGNLWLPGVLHGLWPLNIS